MKIIPNPIVSAAMSTSSPPALSSSFSDDDANAELGSDPLPATPQHITVQFSDEDLSISSSSSPGDSGLFCSPAPLPTPLGIPRMFVSSAHRRKGIAQALLDATTRTFIHGCPLHPELGQVAFSQPTRAGRAVMENWGKGGVRIYEE